MYAYVNGPLKHSVASLQQYYNDCVKATPWNTYIHIYMGANCDWDIRISDLVKNPVVDFGKVRRAQ